MSRLTTTDSGHNGPVLDIVVDSLGQLAATSGEDGVVQIWAVREGAQLHKITTLQKGPHQAPVLNIAWSEGAQLLASSDENGGFAIWHDAARQHKQWSCTFQQALPGVPTAVAWAPVEHGLVVAVSLSTGKVLTFTGKDPQQWEGNEIDAHQGVVSGVSWSPYLAAGSLVGLPLTAMQGGQTSSNAAAVAPPPQRLVTVGTDGAVRVWQYAAADRHWRREELHVESGGDGSPQSPLLWSSVAWAGNIGMPFTYIAAGSVEGVVVVWRQDGLDGRWHCIVLPRVFEDAVTRVAWSAVGTFLIVSCANGTFTTWKESTTGDWELLSSMQ